jgi:hypothetical protein
MGSGRREQEEEQGTETVLIQASKNEGPYTDLGRKTLHVTG